MFGWFAAGASKRFGKELATLLMADIASASAQSDRKFSAKAERALVKAARRVDEFRRSERLNGYKKAQLANAFLWTLKDGGCSPEYTRQLTDWLTERL